MKYISRVNQSRHADHDLGGHFHTLEFHKFYTVNGSLIGCTPYSLSSGFPANDPEQALLVVDKDLGIVNRITVPVVQSL